MSFLGTETWQLRYQRNNKQSGLKNIRCFPHCSDPHRLRGFCGNSITFKLDEAPPAHSVAFGEFALRESVSIQPGDVISRDTITQNERVEDLFKPWHRGELIKSTSSIIFNRQKKGWHYSWVSNKHTSDSEHVFRIYLCEEIQPGDPQTNLQCVAVFDSPAFTIFCRRRDKSGVKHLPPQFATQVKNSNNSSGASEEDEEDAEEDEEDEPEEKPKRRKSQRASEVVRSPPSTTELLPGRESGRSTRKRAKPTSSTTPMASSSSASAMMLASGQHRKDISAEESNMVFRILAALTNVHDRQQGASSSPPPASAAASSVTTASTPATPSTAETDENSDETDLFDFSKAITDCFDWVTPENINDSQFFDSLFAQPSAKPVEDMLIRLGQYLMKEDFTREIEDVFAHRKSGGEESKKQVVACLKDKFDRFFEKEGSSLVRFDRDLLAHSPQLAEEKPSHFALLFPSSTTISMHNPGSLETMFRPPFRVVPGGLHDFTGHWRRPASTLENMERMRSIIGFSWIERKLMLQMEQEFFIWYEGNTMFVRGQRKLAGSNCLIHIIDGVDYPFVQPSAMLGDTPAIGLFNRTWATEDGVMHFVTTYTVEWRTHRKTKRSACGNRLESTITLQRNPSCHLPGVWEDLYTLPSVAERVTSMLSAAS